MHNRSKGFGLIEVMVAVAVIAGAALLVSQFISNQAKQQIQVRSSSDCEAAINGVIAKIKQLDSNTSINKWMPTDGEMQPADDTNYLQTRMGLAISSTLDQASPGLITKNNMSSNMNNYSATEDTMAGVINNYQLIYSATNMLAGYFNADSTYCSTEHEITRDQSDYLSTIVSDSINDETTIAATIERVRLSTGTVLANACSSWTPVPVNASSKVNTNSDEGFRLALKATYQTPEGTTKTCQGSATFSAGSDLIAPTVDATITPQAGLTALASGVLCGTGTSASFTIAIAPTSAAEDGVQYLCRLDYLAGRYTGAAVNYTETSGWFFCSAPTAALTAMAPGGQALTVSVLTSPPPSANGVNFTVGNASEGSYKLHVKAVDVARNEAVVTKDILLDLSRPTLLTVSQKYPTSTVTNLNTYNYQCNDRNHASWVPTYVDINSAQIQVSSNSIRERYVSGAALDPSFSCASASTAAFATWPSDGPKTAEFAACDECSIANAAFLAVAPDKLDFLWFVDTIDTDMVPSPATVTLDALRVMTYNFNASNNSANPYKLSHSILSSVGGLPNAGSVTTTNNHVKNSYTSRTINTNIVPAFTAQTAINSCLPYGTYSYTMTSGCSSRAAQSVSVVYGTNDTPLSTLCDPVTPAFPEISNNTRYCPTFTNKPAASSCAPLVGCVTEISNGYCGSRPPPSCTFVSGKNTSCKFPACNLPWGGTLEVGESITTVLNPNPPCGQPCGSGTMTCRWNGTNSYLTGSGGNPAICNVTSCPTCATHPTHTLNCTSCSEAGCIDIGSGVCCKEPATPTPTPTPGCVGSWGACSATCDGGTQTYTLTSGSGCTPADGDTQACNTQACSAVIDCVGHWSDCSQPCGGGTQTYIVDTAAQNGGVACPATAGQTQACNTQACTPCLADEVEYTAQPYNACSSGSEYEACGAGLSGCQNCPYYRFCNVNNGTVCAKPYTPGYYSWEDCEVAQTTTSNDYCRFPDGTSGPISNLPACNESLLFERVDCRDSGNNSHVVQCQP
ncbi:MAG: thrombospondin type-1 domain-containing protein [Bdellovibrionales bacterium]|nr:thrombospondin type-1 domain-containing protein [Bdellovibrionales bacterium]